MSRFLGLAVLFTMRYSSNHKLTQLRISSSLTQISGIEMKHFRYSYLWIEESRTNATEKKTLFQFNNWKVLNFPQLFIYSLLPISLLRAHQVIIYRQKMSFFHLSELSSENILLLCLWAHKNEIFQQLMNLTSLNLMQQDKNSLVFIANIKFHPQKQ